MFRRLYKIYIDRKKRAWNKRYAKQIKEQQAKFRAEAFFLANEYEKRISVEEVRKHTVRNGNLPSNLEVSFLKEAFVKDFVYYYGKNMELSKYFAFYTYEENP